MPYLEDTDPGWIDLQKRIQSAIEPFAAELGARICDHGDWSECEDGCSFVESRPKDGSMPTIVAFTLVTDVKDVAHDLNDVAVVAAPNQRNSMTKGLLHVALYE